MDEVLGLRLRPGTRGKHLGHLGGFAGEHEFDDAVDVLVVDEATQSLQVGAIGGGHLGGESGEGGWEDEGDLVEPTGHGVGDAQQVEESSGGHRDAQRPARRGCAHRVGEHLGDLWIGPSGAG